MKILQMSYKKEGLLSLSLKIFRIPKSPWRRLKGITLSAPLNGADGTEPSPAMI